MSAADDLYVRLQDRLGVDSSYLEDDIPNGVQRAVKRLLRDYHFPKSVRTHAWQNVAAGAQVYTLPADFKKDLLVVFQDTSVSSAPVYTAPLTKREGFVLPQQDQVPRHYWLQGNDLWTDIILPDVPKTNLLLAYESNDAGYNLEWMLQDMEDVIFSLSMFRLSSELGKPELAQVYVALWTEDQRSLAIYLNELEFNNAEIMMRASTPPRGERYPVV